MVVLTTGAYAAFAHVRLWLPAVALGGQGGVIFLASLGIWYVQTERERRWVRMAFSHYVPPAVLETLLAHPDQIELGGREVDATILFTDLIGFSSMVEGRTPRKVVTTLNEFLTEFTDIIFRHRGTIDRFMGDGIMAFWGAPVEAPDHALLACRAAIEMRQAMEDLKVRWAARGYRSEGVRIGINTGPAIVGNMGSRKFVGYSAVGDATNTASRLEQVNRTFGTTIILSESTYWAVRDAVVVRELGTITVRGRVRPVTTYELVALRDRELPADEWEFLEGYRKALEAFKAGRRDEAAGRLEVLLTMRPEDGPSRELLRRCWEGN